MISDKLKRFFSGRWDAPLKYVTYRSSVYLFTKISLIKIDMVGQNILQLYSVETPLTVKNFLGSIKFYNVFNKVSDFLICLVIFIWRRILINICWLNYSISTSKNPEINFTKNHCLIRKSPYKSFRKSFLNNQLIN